MKGRILAATALFTVASLAGVDAQDPQAGCWMRGERADLELRASPYDSTDLVLDGGTVKVCYSRPRKLGRPIMGRLVPYGEVWRFGANEATALRVSSRATVAGVAVEPGWYSLMVIPEERDWRIIVNGEARRWGVPIDDEVRSEDVGSGVVPSSKEVGVVELFTLELERTAPGAADLVMAWDRTRLRIPVILRSGDGEPGGER